MEDNEMITNKPDAPLVSREVADGVNAARESGRYNMFDAQSVAEWCDLYGFPEAAEWIEANKSLYARSIFSGFRVEG